jgi:hypothetical protein
MAPTAYSSRMKSLAVIVLALSTVAYADGKKYERLPCDAKTLTKLSKSLSTGKANLAGKKFIFDGCKLDSQGNDTVSLGASDGGATVGCVMRDGEKGMEAFRGKAMQIEPAKLRLDVWATIGEVGAKGSSKLGLTNCTIAAHN